MVPRRPSRRPMTVFTTPTTLVSWVGLLCVAGVGAAATSTAKSATVQMKSWNLASIVAVNNARSRCERMRDGVVK